MLSRPSHLCLFHRLQDLKEVEQPAHVSPSSGKLRPAQVCATGPRPPFPVRPIYIFFILWESALFVICC